MVSFILKNHRTLLQKSSRWNTWTWFPMSKSWTQSILTTSNKVISGMNLAEKNKSNTKLRFSKNQKTGVSKAAAAKFKPKATIVALLVLSYMITTTNLRITQREWEAWNLKNKIIFKEKLENLYWAIIFLKMLQLLTLFKVIATELILIMY